MLAALNNELEKWTDLGMTAEFWWRDDDVQRPSAPLTRLLSISEKYDAPLALAAIPDGVAPLLSQALSSCEGVSVLQHGFSHQNFAPDTERKMELGWHRSELEITAQIKLGKEKLDALFGRQFVSVMVPPWNRIDSRVITCLPDLGLVGLSTLGPRKHTMPVDGLRQVNVHLDIIDWKNGRRFAGPDRCLHQLVTHLSAKREGRADIAEPTGVMSHHLVHDSASWDFLEALFSILGQHQNAVVLGAKDCFKPLV